MSFGSFWQVSGLTFAEFLQCRPLRAKPDRIIRQRRGTETHGDTMTGHRANLMHTLELPR